MGKNPKIQRWKPIVFDGEELQFKDDPVEIELEEPEQIKGLARSREVKSVKLKEKWDRIVVKAKAPIPEEVSNEEQAMALSRNAAIVMAQNKIMSHIMKEKTKSGKTLAVAAHPYLEIQEKLKGLVQGAAVKRTRWKNGFCQVTVEMSKKQLKKILKEN